MMNDERKKEAEVSDPRTFRSPSILIPSLFIIHHSSFIVSSFIMSYLSTILADSPFVYWRLGEATGSTAADASGNGRDGSYTGSLTLARPGATADGDTAALFAGGRVAPA